MPERRNIKRREFIDQYFPYVRSMIFKYKRSLPVGMEVGDLLNSGVIGLILAADNYDEEKAGKDFMSYANFRVKGEIITALRAGDRLTRQMRDKIKVYLITQSDLQHELGRDPTDEEIMEKAGLTKKQMLSINTLMSMDMDDISGETISQDHVDYCADIEDLVQKISDKDIIHIKLPEAINDLSEKEQHVIRSYYLDDDPKLLREIGEELQVTESRVSQIRTQAINKLKKKLNNIKESV